MGHCGDVHLGSDSCSHKNSLPERAAAELPFRIDGSWQAEETGEEEVRSDYLVRSDLPTTLI